MCNWEVSLHRATIPFDARSLSSQNKMEIVRDKQIWGTAAVFAVTFLGDLPEIRTWDIPIMGTNSFNSNMLEWLKISSQSFSKYEYHTIDIMILWSTHISQHNVTSLHNKCAWNDAYMSLDLLCIQRNHKNTLVLSSRPLGVEINLSCCEGRNLRHISVVFRFVRQRAIEKIIFVNSHKAHHNTQELNGLA